MGWTAAVVAGLGVMQYQQQGAIGKYNQAVQNRNATIAEQEAAMIEKQLEFDIGRFDQQFQQLKGTTEVNLNKSGVVSGEGTAFRIARYNAEQAVLQKNVMDYNSKVAVGKKLEEANFARIQGQMARQSAKMAQLQTIAKTGTSLMTMGSGVSGTNTAQLNMAYPAQYGTF
jgi:hypothetical protein